MATKKYFYAAIDLLGEHCQLKIAGQKSKLYLMKTLSHIPTQKPSDLKRSPNTFHFHQFPITQIWQGFRPPVVALP